MRGKGRGLGARAGLALVSLVLLVAASACGKGDKAGVPPAQNIGDACGAGSPELSCDGTDAVHCLDAGVEQRESCAEKNMNCDPDWGCIACEPNAASCKGNDLYQCDALGQKNAFVQHCATGTNCSPNGCTDLCADALTQRSYIGCDYWPTFTSNSQLDPVFLPAVVIANPNLVDAEVSISKSGMTTLHEKVPPQTSKSVLLAFDAALKGADDLDIGGSVLVAGGAYHLVSSVPVTVYQFNPLLFEIQKECLAPNAPGDPEDGKCDSFTADSSLLLPSHVLTREDGTGISYLGVSRTSFMSVAKVDDSVHILPGFLALTAVGDRPVTVQLTSHAELRASKSGDIAAMKPGDELMQVLMPGDVLELRASGPASASCPGETKVFLTGDPKEYTVCDPGSRYDPTGTEIRADGPLQVIGGHDCTYIPFDRPACDHLEETLFPVETWGKQVIVTRPRSSVGTEYRLRVISSADGNKVSFLPELAKPVTLKRGEYYELDTDQHVIVTGTKPILVAQYLEGQGGSRTSGDPSLSLAIPTDQFRGEYYFLSPETYDVNYLNVLAQSGTDVLLDGELVENFETIEGSDYVVAAVSLRNSGAHEIRSRHGEPIGLVLYGYGDYTSYMMPGGLDLKEISTPL